MNLVLGLIFRYKGPIFWLCVDWYTVCRMRYECLYGLYDCEKYRICFFRMENGERPLLRCSLFNIKHTQRSQTKCIIIFIKNLFLVGTQKRTNIFCTLRSHWNFSSAVSLYYFNSAAAMCIENKYIMVSASINTYAQENRNKWCVWAKANKSANLYWN